MLVRCIECEGKVSDKAVSCPKCGMIFSTDPKIRRDLFKKKVDEILKRLEKKSVEDNKDLEIAEESLEVLNNNIENNPKKDDEEQENFLYQ